MTSTHQWAMYMYLRSPKSWRNVGRRTITTHGAACLWSVLTIEIACARVDLRLGNVERRYGFGVFEVLHQTSCDQHQC